MATTSRTTASLTPVSSRVEGPKGGENSDVSLRSAWAAGVYYWDSVFLVALSVGALSAEHLSSSNPLRLPTMVSSVVAIAASVAVPIVLVHKAGLPDLRFTSGFANVGHDRYLIGFHRTMTRWTEGLVLVCIVVAIVGVVLNPVWRWSIGLTVACIPLALHRGTIDLIFRRIGGNQLRPSR